MNEVTFTEGSRFVNFHGYSSLSAALVVGESLERKGCTSIKVDNQPFEDVYHVFVQLLYSD